MPVTDRKYLRKRRDRWLVQVAVPKKLRNHFGKPNLEKYLGTSSEVEARELRWPVVAELKGRIKRAREGAALTPEDIKREAEAELRRSYEALVADFLDTHGKLPDLARDVAEDIEEPLNALFQGNPLLGKTTAQYAEEVIERIGAEKNEKSVSALTQEILKAQAAAIAMVQRGIHPPPLAGQPIKRVRHGSAPTVSEAAERYIEDRQRDPNASLTAQTITQTRTSFRLFASYTEDARLDEVTREDAAGFLEAMGRLHPHYGRRRDAKKLSLAELLKKYPATDGTGLSNRTLNRHQITMLGLFKWCKRYGLLDGENPFTELSRPIGNNPWLPLRIEELNALFEGRSFEVQPSSHTLATSVPWVMLIALYSGMRQGEICELDAEDVQQQDGVFYFDVTEAKSEAGVRRVPVHSELIRLELLKYVAAIGSGPLFPGITRGGPDKKRAHTVAKRFTAYRRGRGVERDRVSFHSFRKCFVRALEIAKVNRDRAALVVGHERGFTWRVYNPEGIDVAGLKEVVEQVRYKGLELSQQSASGGP